MSNEQPEQVPPVDSKRSTATIIIVAVFAALLASALTAWLLLGYFFPKEFRPVELNAREQQVLSQKLDYFGSVDPSSTAAPTTAPRQPLEPEPYSEQDASRTIRFTERELNALLANNTELAHKLAIDLSSDLASAKLLIPLDPEFPILGGKTLKLSAGLELAYHEGRPVAVLRGLSLWGVPMPNAWLGGMKNVDLFGEFSGEPGFWQSLAAGVDYLEVKEGELHVKLKE